MPKAKPPIPTQAAGDNDPTLSISPGDRCTLPLPAGFQYIVSS